MMNYQNSKYYCFEYRLPIESVLFDEDEKLLFRGKLIYFFNRIFNCLYDYNISNS